MLLIPCPNCGPRPEAEFTYGGQAHVQRTVEDTHSDEQMAEFLYLRRNPKGVHVERWRHAHGCTKFFNTVRHTVTDKILATYRVGEPTPDLDALARSPAVRVAGAVSGGVDPTRGETA